MNHHQLTRLAVYKLLAQQNLLLPLTEIAPNSNVKTEPFVDLSHRVSKVELVLHGLPLLQSLCDNLSIWLAPLYADDPYLQGSLAKFTPADPENQALGGELAYSLDLGEGELVFAIAHEVAHFQLHWGQVLDCHTQDLDLDTTSTGIPGEDTVISGAVEVYNPHNRREQEANIFALELLMPSSELIYHYLRLAKEATARSVTPATATSSNGSSTLPTNVITESSSHQYLTLDALEASQFDLLSMLAGHFNVNPYRLLMQLNNAFLLSPLPDLELATISQTLEAESFTQSTSESAPNSSEKVIAKPIALDRDQARAVTTATPALVLAGPGSGKTRTLVERVRFLIEGEQQILPARLLVLTFSNKAAGELRERLTSSGIAAENMLISTFHAYGVDFLRRYAERVGLPPDFRLLDQAHAYMLMEDLLVQFPQGYYINLNSPFQYLKDLLTDISRAKDYLHTPDDYNRAVQEMAQAIVSTDVPLQPSYQETDVNRARERAQIYRIYEQNKKARGLVDFGDLVMLPVHLMQSDESVRLTEQNRYDQVLVDEFQDINYASGQLLQLLCSPKHLGKGNIWAVGDLNQSIYRFRGAFPRQAGATAFRKDFGGITQKGTPVEVNVLELSYNYRSLPPIVELANHLREEMPVEGATQPLQAVRTLNPPPVATPFSTSASQDFSLDTTKPVTTLFNGNDASEEVVAAKEKISFNCFVISEEEGDTLKPREELLTRPEVVPIATIEYRNNNSSTQPLLYYNLYPTTEIEFATIANSIRQHLEQGYLYSDHAILCQTHAQADRLASYLTSKGISVSRLGSFFNRPAIQTLLALISFLSEETSLALFRLGANQLAVTTLLRLAQEFKISPRQALRDVRVQKGLDYQSQQVSARLAETLENLSTYRSQWYLLADYLFAHSSLLLNLVAPSSTAARSIATEQQSFEKSTTINSEETYQDLRALGQLLRLAVSFDREEEAKIYRAEQLKLGRPLTSEEKDTLKRERLRPTTMRKGFLRYINALVQPDTRIEMGDELTTTTTTTTTAAKAVTTTATTTVITANKGTLKKDSETGNSTQELGNSDGRLLFDGSSEGNSSGRVQILTAHSSKGLEYPFVYLPGLHHSNHFTYDPTLPPPPNFHYNEGEGREADETCLFYVSATRARDQLYLSWAELDLSDPETSGNGESEDDENVNGSSGSNSAASSSSAASKDSKGIVNEENVAKTKTVAAGAAGLVKRRKIHKVLEPALRHRENYPDLWGSLEELATTSATSSSSLNESDLEKNFNASSNKSSEKALSSWITTSSKSSLDQVVTTITNVGSGANGQEADVNWPAPIVFDYHKLTRYDDCPSRYYYQYVLQGRSNVANRAGNDKSPFYTALAAAQKIMYEGLIQGKDLPDLASILETYSSTWKCPRRPQTSVVNSSLDANGTSAVEGEAETEGVAANTFGLSAQAAENGSVSVISSFQDSNDGSNSTINGDKGGIDESYTNAVDTPPTTTSSNNNNNETTLADYYYLLGEQTLKEIWQDKQTEKARSQLSASNNPQAVLKVEFDVEQTVQLKNNMVRFRIERVETLADGSKRLIHSRLKAIPEDAKKLDADKDYRLMALYALANPNTAGKPTNKVILEAVGTNGVIQVEASKAYKKAEAYLKWQNGKTQSPGLIKKVDNWAQSIRENRFAPKPGQQCSSCPFYTIVCPEKGL